MNCVRSGCQNRVVAVIQSPSPDYEGRYGNTPVCQQDLNDVAQTMPGGYIFHLRAPPEGPEPSLDATPRKQPRTRVRSNGREP